MVFISNLPPAGGGNGMVTSVQPQAVLQAQNAQSASPTAQQILPQAVIASTAVPGYTSETPKPPKPPLRQGSVPQQPSSLLAAQFMAQAPETEEHTFMIFQPRAQVDADAPAPEPEYLTQLRQARGDVAPPPQTPASNTPAALAQNSQATATQATQNSAVLANAVSTAPLPRAAIAPEQRYQTPPVQQSIAGKKSSVALTRGAASYALTELRNAVGFVAPTVEAVS